VSSCRPRGAADSFEWPPSPTDLSTISVMLLGGASPARAKPTPVYRSASNDGHVAGTPIVRRSAQAEFDKPTLRWMVLAATASAATPEAERRVHRHSTRRRARLNTFQQLTLLAAGMLVGAALPGLDDGRRPIVGVARAAEASSIAPPAVAKPAARTGMALSAPPVAATPRGAVPPDAWTPPTGQQAIAARAVGSVPTAVRSIPRPLSTPARSVDPRTQQVLGLLRSYQAAYSRMDASAAAKVWPSANLEALTRAFTAVREQRLWLHGCTISGTGAQASGTCRGTLRYRPRVGDHSTRLRYGTWQFALEREAGRWLIRRVTVS
jgi:hypothetical protein